MLFTKAAKGLPHGNDDGDQIYPCTNHWKNPPLRDQSWATAPSAKDKRDF